MDCSAPPTQMRLANCENGIQGLRICFPLGLGNPSVSLRRHRCRSGSPSSPSVAPGVLSSSPALHRLRFSAFPNAGALLTFGLCLARPAHAWSFCSSFLNSILLPLHALSTVSPMVCFRRTCRTAIVTTQQQLHHLSLENEWGCGALVLRLSTRAGILVLASFRAGFLKKCPSGHLPPPCLVGIPPTNDENEPKALSTQGVHGKRPLQEPDAEPSKVRKAKHRARANE